MPEASINHDREPPTRKCDVHSDGADIRERNEIVDTEAQSSRVEG